METVNEYIENISPEWKQAFEQLRKAIIENLPQGFDEELCYGMVGYVVPLSKYPKGYHCKANQPLPFINIAAQKNFIALYHMGIYANKELYDWFVGEYPNYSNKKLDMGKSCIRFKKAEDIPFKLIAELVSKIKVEQWIQYYENAFIKK